MSMYRKFGSRESAEFLAKLPKWIEVVLMEGRHKGQRQLYAEWDHEGEPYKLVVADASITVWNPQVGDGKTWMAHPNFSPNGYIIFCAIYPEEKVPQGETILRMKRRQGLSPDGTSDPFAKRM